MLKRTLLLLLGVWLIAASGLSAHAGPCGMEDAQAKIAVTATDHAHCDMMAAPEPSAPNKLDHQGTDGTCCCPAVLAALPGTDAPYTEPFAFALPHDFPLDARAPSRTLVPEPRPPKA